ncbi:hypothetical protein SprV_1002807900 [Sparganum proliferum]
MGASQRCRFEDPSTKWPTAYQAEPRLDDADATFNQPADQRRGGATSRRRRHGVPSDHRPRSPQYPVHVAQRTQGVTALTWFSPPVEAVARGVAADQSPATWSHR